MTPSKRDFVQALISHCTEHGWPEILRLPCEFKTENWFGERMFVHQWQDGQIERKDTYHFDGALITLFASQKRYDYGARWLDEN